MDKELIYEKLPADIAERHVLLMDPILATGNSAVRAIQVGMVSAWTSQHRERAGPIPAEQHSAHSSWHSRACTAGFS